MKKYRGLITLLAIAVVTIAGCDAVGGLDAPEDAAALEQTERSGRLRLLLTDAPFPFDLVEEANVTISRIEIVRASGSGDDPTDDPAGPDTTDAAPGDTTVADTTGSDTTGVDTTGAGGSDVQAARFRIGGEETGDGPGGILTLSEDTMTFNLLALRDGVTAVLSETEIAAGRYTQIRLIVTDASVKLKDDPSLGRHAGRVFDMKVPSGPQTGIKIPLPDLVVEAGEETSYTLDFDVSRSFVVKGNPRTPAGIKGFIFKPVVVPLGDTSGEPGGEE